VKFILLIFPVHLITVAGTALAGPVGFVVGSYIGSQAGSKALGDSDKEKESSSSNCLAPQPSMQKPEADPNDLMGSFESQCTVQTYGQPAQSHRTQLLMQEPFVSEQHLSNQHSDAAVDPFASSNTNFAPNVPISAHPPKSTCTDWTDPFAPVGAFQQPAAPANPDPTASQHSSFYVPPSAFDVAHQAQLLDPAELAMSTQQTANADETTNWLVSGSQETPSSLFHPLDVSRPQHIHHSNLGSFATSTNTSQPQETPSVAHEYAPPSATHQQQITDHPLHESAEMYSPIQQQQQQQIRSSPPQPFQVNAPQYAQFDPSSLSMSCNPSSHQQSSTRNVVHQPQPTTYQQPTVHARPLGQTGGQLTHQHQQSTQSTMHSAQQQEQRQGYRFGDVTRSVLAKGKKKQGRSEQDGYKFGDFTRGLFG